MSSLALPTAPQSSGASAAASIPAVPPAARPGPDDAALAALQARFAATAAQHDAAGTLPLENFAALHAQGLTGLTVARALGGPQAPLAQARRVIEATAKGEAATALILTMTYLQQRQIGRADSRWPAHLRERVARDTLGRGALINALRVEPELGSPARGGLPATTARRVDGHWRISGRKIYSTGSSALGWLAVWARTDEEAPRVGVFLVPAATPGLRVEETWNHLGLRASGSHDVVFEDAAVPLDHAVDIRPPEAWAPSGASQADVDANAEQQAWMVVLLGALYDGVAQAARDWLVAFLRARAPASLGRPLATLPRVQEAVGEIDALLYTNRQLLDQATRSTDAGSPPRFTDSGLLKFAVTGNAIRAVELALRLSGNHGLSRHNPLERHHRDVLCSRIHTPQDDSILLAAGQAALAA